VAVVAVQNQPARIGALVAAGLLDEPTRRLCACPLGDRPADDASAPASMMT
jgi:hypothetical protein